LGLQPLRNHRERSRDPLLSVTSVSLWQILEVAAGLEPAKTGFADQRLDHFGIATQFLLLVHPSAQLLHAACANSARVKFTIGAPTRFPHSVQDPS
jgi:hypothetical protein